MECFLKDMQAKQLVIANKNNQSQLKFSSKMVRIKFTTQEIFPKQDCERITQRFQQKLNFAVFGHAAKRHGKTLKYLPVVEGELSGKHLHLHFAIGNLPKHVRFNQFDALVCQAKKYVEHVDEQHKVDIADSGWLEYITKETATKHSDNVLWQLVK